MHIVVLIKQVPDLAEGLEINAGGTGLDPDWLAYRMNEFDEHALEQALLLKEQHGGSVTAVAPDRGSPDESLFTCLAKGADRAVRVAGDLAAGMANRDLARLLAPVLQDLRPDLVLTGVQAVDDLDGQIGPFLAAEMGLPWVSVVTGVELAGAAAVVHKEYAGGVVAELEVDLPAVLGIQAAAQPPRYAAISKVRQAMKTARLEEMDAAAGGAPVAVRRMYVPQSGARAEMIPGDAGAVAARLIEILAQRGILRG